MAASPRYPTRPAAPPSVPKASAAQLQELAVQEAYQREREALERRRQVRALLMLVFVVLIFSIARSGVDRVFPHLWWKLW